MKIDKIDLKILHILQKSGREPASNIADRINVSVPTITERIRKMQDSGVIIGFQAILEPIIPPPIIAILLTKLLCQFSYERRGKNSSRNAKN